MWPVLATAAQWHIRHSMAFNCNADEVMMAIAAEGTRGSSKIAEGEGRVEGAKATDSGARSAAAWRTHVILQSSLHQRVLQGVPVAVREDQGPRPNAAAASTLASATTEMFVPAAGKEARWNNKTRRLGMQIRAAFEAFRCAPPECSLAGGEPSGHSVGAKKEVPPARRPHPRTPAWRIYPCGGLWWPHEPHQTDDDVDAWAGMQPA
eukprot:363670-Chlamydomonas_euryale.AAC.12